jgi:hypothetical protein
MPIEQRLFGGLQETLHPQRLLIIETNKRRFRQIVCYCRIRHETPKDPSALCFPNLFTNSTLHHSFLDGVSLVMILVFQLYLLMKSFIIVLWLRLGKGCPFVFQIYLPTLLFIIVSWIG